MARVWIISLLVAGLISAAWGQAFGRFGYRSAPEIDDFAFSDQGFRAKSARADLFRFSSAAPLGRAVEVTGSSAVYWVKGKAGGPTKLRLNDYAPGFELFFAQGVRLGLTSTQAPYLSWNEGSVGPGVPTPPANWILLSFQDDQPAILLCSPGQNLSMKLEGRPGDWKLVTESDAPIWIRFALPFGLEPLATLDVAALGSACLRVKAHEALWTQPGPRLLGVEARASEAGIVGVWRFDQPNVLLPLGAMMAPSGGYGLRMLSGLKLVDGPGLQRPMAYVTGGRLAIEFPMAPLKPGRSVVLGVPDGRKFPLGSAFQLEYVYALALEVLLATPDLSIDRLANGALNDYLVTAPNEAEPLTAQRLPFRSTGEGLDLAAAQALLAETLLTSQGKPDPNPLLTSILWTRHASTWMPALPDPLVNRRAAALAAVAGWASLDPVRRLEGAMFEAALASERGLALWRKQRGLEAETVFREPVEKLRRSVFSVRDVWAIDPFVRSLQSDLRVVGEVRAAMVDGPDGPRLMWRSGSEVEPVLQLTSPTSLQLEKATNLKSILALPPTDWQSYRFEAFGPGDCFAKLLSPNWGTETARWIAPPGYTESSR